MAASTLDTARTPFRRFERKKATMQGSKRLGLSIVRRLVVNAHGAIHLHTHVDEGSTFTILLRAS